MFALSRADPENILSWYSFRPGWVTTKFYHFRNIGKSRGPDPRMVFVCKKAHVTNGGSNGITAYPENTNFETFVPRNLKFHTFGDLKTTKK